MVRIEADQCQRSVSILKLRRSVRILGVRFLATKIWNGNNLIEPGLRLHGTRPNSQEWKDDVEKT